MQGSQFFKRFFSTNVHNGAWIEKINNYGKVFFVLGGFGVTIVGATTYLIDSKLESLKDQMIEISNSLKNDMTVRYESIQKAVTDKTEALKSSMDDKTKALKMIKPTH